MKAIIKITGVIICAIALFMNINLTGNTNSNDTDLSGLTKVNQANAECIQNNYGWNHGRCSQLSGNCYWDPDGDDCDWTLG